jgi:hypothetical protein
VTVDPGQKGLDEAVMVTPAGKLEFSSIRTAGLEAGSFVLQSSEEERIHTTRSPFAGEYVKA